MLIYWRRLVIRVILNTLGYHAVSATIIYCICIALDHRVSVSRIRDQRDLFTHTDKVYPIDPAGIHHK